MDYDKQYMQDFIDFTIENLKFEKEGVNDPHCIAVNKGVSLSQFIKDDKHTDVEKAKTCYAILCACKYIDGNYKDNDYIISGFTTDGWRALLTASEKYKLT